MLGPCQTVAARLSGCANSTLTQQGLKLQRHGTRAPWCPQPGGGAARRMFSDKAAEGASATQPTAMQRLRQMSAETGGTFRALTQTTGKTSQTVFRQLPEKVTAASGRIRKQTPICMIRCSAPMLNVQDDLVS